MDKIRLFIADDSDIIRKMVRSFIARSNEAQLVGEAADGREAVRQCKLLRPDIILLDVNMPLLNGIEAAKVLNFSLPGSTLVMLSGMDDPEIRRDAMVAGAKEFIAKPLTASVFTAKIKEIFGRSGPAARPAVVPDADPGVAAASSPTRHRLLAVVGARPGSGATTLVANAAVSLTLRHRWSVLVVDSDLQYGDLSRLLGVHAGPGLAEAARSPLKTAAALRPFVTDTGYGVSLLASPALGGVDTPPVLMAADVAAALQALRVQFDAVLLDVPPIFADLLATMAAISEQVLLVVGNDAQAARGAALALGYLRRVGCAEDQLKVIQSCSRGTERLPRNELEAALGAPVSLEIPFDAVRIRDSAAAGKPFALQAAAELGTAVERFADLLYAT